MEKMGPSRTHGDPTITWNLYLPSILWVLILTYKVNCVVLNGCADFSEHDKCDVFPDSQENTLILAVSL